MKISVILSCFNERDNPYFSKIIQQFNSPNYDLIVVDGGSTDGTVEWLKTYQIRPIILPHSTRGARLNHGIERANSDSILLQHPRSLIDAQGLEYLAQHASGLDWAVFTHRFDHNHMLLKYISWYSNKVRVERKHITYLDHCIFLKRALLTKPIPDIAIFEDTALSYILQQHAKPIRLPHYATTSAIRFLDRGVFRQFLTNQWVKCLYHAKINPKKINAIYEKRMNLNQKN